MDADGITANVIEAVEDGLSRLAAAQADAYATSEAVDDWTRIHGDGTGGGFTRAMSRLLARLPKGTTLCLK